MSAMCGSGVHVAVGPGVGVAPMIDRSTACAPQCKRRFARWGCCNIASIFLFPFFVVSLGFKKEDPGRMGRGLRSCSYRTEMIANSVLLCTDSPLLVVC